MILHCSEYLFVNVDGDDSFVVMIFNDWNSDLRIWNKASIKNGYSKTKDLLFWFLNTAERILHRQQVEPHYMYILNWVISPYAQQVTRDVIQWTVVHKCI